MHRYLKIILIILIFCVVIFPGCKKNKKPDMPSIPAGPTSGSINTEYTFYSSAEDPDDDSIAIRFDWGDEDTSNWCSFFPCGDSISMSHSWSDTGTYSIKAQAQDLNEAVSAWSSGHQIIISTFNPSNNPPNTPTTPRGASTGLLNISYSFVSTATDQDGDSIAIRFDWGDGDTSDWSDWQASGDSISMSHSWSDYDNYSIKAQAKDKEADTSNWSNSHQIKISVGWTKTFGGSDDDYGESVEQTSDSGYIITGHTKSYGTGDFDIYLIKTDASGNEQWYKTFGGSYDDAGYSVKQTSDGGYIITGYTESYGAGEKDVYLIKTDANGNEQWDTTFGFLNDDFGYSVCQTSDGGYAITGSYSPWGPWDTMPDVCLIKTDANGNQQWVKVFGGGDDWDCGYSVEQTSDGGYIIVGVSDWGTDWKQVYLNKTDANGNRTWYRRFGGDHDDAGNSVQQTSDGGYIITGYTQSYGAGSHDIYLIKTDENGIEQWYKTFGSGGDDGGWSVQQTSDGGYIITGYTQLLGYYDVYLIKTYANGNNQWDKIIGGSDGESGHSVQQTSDGGYIITGNTRSYGAGGADVWLIKTDANGNVE